MTATTRRRGARYEAKPLLRAVRARSGRSLADVADACEITKQALSLIERGERATTVHLALRIAQTLGVDREDCFEVTGG